MIPPPVHFGVFGNHRLGDCSVVALANLEQAAFPGIKITTNDVVREWRATDEVLQDVLTCGENHSLGGVKVSSWQWLTSVTPQTVAQGSVEGVIRKDGGYHAVAVLGATASTVTYVDEGRIVHHKFNLVEAFVVTFS